MRISSITVEEEYENDAGEMLMVIEVRREARKTILTFFLPSVIFMTMRLLPLELICTYIHTFKKICDKTLVKPVTASYVAASVYSSSGENKIHASITNTS